MCCAMKICSPCQSFTTGMPLANFTAFINFKGASCYKFVHIMVFNTSNTLKEERETCTSALIVADRLDIIDLLGQSLYPTVLRY